MKTRELRFVQLLLDDEGRPAHGLDAEGRIWERGFLGPKGIWTRFSQAGAKEIWRRRKALTDEPPEA